MRQAPALATVLFVLLATSAPVTPQPWNLPRPVVLNGCSENALIIAVKACAKDSGCAAGLANYENVEPPMTICCERGQWGLKPKRGAGACRLYDRIPVRPPELAPFR